MFVSRTLHIDVHGVGGSSHFPNQIGNRLRSFSATLTPSKVSNQLEIATVVGSTSDNFACCFTMVKWA
jgi:hypothetical protein